MSDVAGSSGTRGHKGRRGAGIPAPFYNLFELMDFGGINSKDSQGTSIQFTIADIADKVFENGFDARFAATQAIPVVINELVTRFFWAVKKVFVQKSTLLDVVKRNNPELRRMLLTSNGALCLVDGTDATLHAIEKGETPQNPEFWIEFFSRSNIVAWSRFGVQAYQEIIAHFDKDSIDINALDEDVNLEWTRLYSESKMTE